MAQVAVLCDHCGSGSDTGGRSSLAVVFCTSDGCFLCQACDRLIHNNRSTQRHIRVHYTKAPAWAFAEAKANHRVVEPGSIQPPLLSRASGPPALPPHATHPAPSFGPGSDQLPHSWGSDVLGPNTLTMGSVPSHARHMLTGSAPVGGGSGGDGGVGGSATLSGMHQLLSGCSPPGAPQSLAGMGHTSASAAAMPYPLALMRTHSTQLTGLGGGSGHGMDIKQEQQQQQQQQHLSRGNSAFLGGWHGGLGADAVPLGSSYPPFQPQLMQQLQMQQLPLLPQGLAAQQQQQQQQHMQMRPPLPVAVQPALHTHMHMHAQPDVVDRRYELPDLRDMQQMQRLQDQQGLAGQLPPPVSLLDAGVAHAAGAHEGFAALLQEFASGADPLNPLSPGVSLHGAGDALAAVSAAAAALPGASSTAAPPRASQQFLSRGGGFEELSGMGWGGGAGPSGPVHGQDASVRQVKDEASGAVAAAVLLGSGKHPNAQQHQQQSSCDASWGSHLGDLNPLGTLAPRASLAAAAATAAPSMHLHDSPSRTSSVHSLLPGCSDPTSSIAGGGGPFGSSPPGGPLGSSPPAGPLGSSPPVGPHPFLQLAARAGSNPSLGMLGASFPALEGASPPGVYEDVPSLARALRTDSYSGSPGKDTDPVRAAQLQRYRVKRSMRLKTQGDGPKLLTQFEGREGSASRRLPSDTNLRARMRGRIAKAEGADSGTGSDGKAGSVAGGVAGSDYAAAGGAEEVGVDSMDVDVEANRLRRAMSAVNLQQAQQQLRLDPQYTRMHSAEEAGTLMQMQQQQMLQHLASGESVEALQLQLQGSSGGVPGMPAADAASAAAWKWV